MKGRVGLQRVAQRIGQAADFRMGWVFVAVAIDVVEVGQLLGQQSRSAVRCSGVSKLQPRPVGEDRDGTRLADREILLQQPRALHALAIGVQLGSMS